jgi:hypothetical protein
VVEVYDNERIRQRSRMIAVAIDARAQEYPDEPRYCYQPLKNEEAENRWSEATRKSVVHDYNVRDLFI